MVIKDFEKALPSILQRLGIHEQEINVRRESVLIKVPGNFDFKNLLVNKLEKAGINRGTAEGLAAILKMRVNKYKIVK